MVEVVPGVLRRTEYRPSTLSLGPPAGAPMGRRAQHSGVPDSVVRGCAGSRFMGPGDALFVRTGTKRTSMVQRSHRPSLALRPGTQNPHAWRYAQAALTTTGRSSRVSRALYTSPIPPAPAGARISYGPSLSPVDRLIPTAALPRAPASSAQPPSATLARGRPRVRSTGTAYPSDRVRTTRTHLAERGTGVRAWPSRFPPVRR